MSIKPFFISQSSEESDDRNGADRQIKVSVPCQLGIHARCAASIIEFVKQFKSEILVRKGDRAVNGKSILGLMTLGAVWKDRLEIEISGEDADFAARAIDAFFREANYCVDH